MFSLPATTQLDRSRRILIAGCGGGYDVVGGVPLFFELKAAGKEVHLANLSFAHLEGLSGAVKSSALDNLYEVTGRCASHDAYCPEAWLARWLSERVGSEERVFCFDKTGVVALRRAHRHLVEQLGIDTLILVDGGIDALLRGDETSLGTPSEDLASIAAVRDLDVPVKLLACVGLGAELRDGISHAQVFDRIAELTREHGFLGSTTLLAETEGGRAYAEALSFIFENQQEQRQSHIHRTILRAMNGEFGADGPEIWISALLNLYWFFSLDVVAATHLFLDELDSTRTIWDVTQAIANARERIRAQAKSTIPI